MFLEESLWIKSQLCNLNLTTEVKVLDLGSSSLEYRTKRQPYIKENLFKPLEVMGCRVFHLDNKKDNGVDIVCDINQLDTLKDEYDLIICTNLLEHVHDRKKLASDIFHLLKQSGYLIVTVPYNFVYHPDPIDTLYRPTLNDLTKLFKPLSLITSELIETSSALYHINRIKATVMLMKKNKFKTSCALFKKE